MQYFILVIITYFLRKFNLKFVFLSVWRNKNKENLQNFFIKCKVNRKLEVQF
jgi:hypothetical protein